MSLEEKLELLADTIETDVENLDPAKKLDDIQEWDSMAKVSLIVMLDEEFDKEIVADDLLKLETVQDILDIMA